MLLHSLAALLSIVLLLVSVPVTAEMPMGEAGAQPGPSGPTGPGGPGVPVRPPGLPDNLPFPPAERAAQQGAVQQGNFPQGVAPSGAPMPAAGAPDMAPGASNTTSDSAQFGGDSRFKIKKNTYVYRSLFNRDPFFSIITKSQLPAEKNEGPQKAPTESFDLSQMTLIAVIADTESAYALLGLPDGKFYTIHRGDKLGLRDGVVTEIRLDTLVIEEKLRDYKGREISENAFLRLRQEEGE